MKKRMTQLAALLAAAMLVLGGCAEKPEKPVIEEEPEIEIEEVEEPEKEPEEAEETESPLGIHVDKTPKTYYLPESDKAYLYLEYCDVTVEGDNYENLKRNIEGWSLERTEGLRSLYSSFEESAASEAEANEEFYGYSLYQNATVARCDERIVSLIDETWQYTGGAHGENYREGINFDAQSGKRLELREIFSDYETFRTEAVERIIYYLKETYGEELFPDYVDVVENLFADETEPAWYLDGSGIVIVLQQYAVGPYSMGIPEIRFSYGEFKQYIKEAYLPADLEGVSTFKENQELYLKIGEEEYPMMLQCEWEEDFPSCSLWLGQSEKKLEQFEALKGSCLVRTGEEVYCMITVDLASDDNRTYVYRLTDGILDEIAQVDAAVDYGNLNVNGVRMEFYVNMLGSYRGTKTYRFEKEKGFYTEDTEYLLEDNSQVLTTMVDLPVVLDDTESTLPAGSNILLNATDGETYVVFTIQETGQTGTLQVQRSSEDQYQILVDGRDEQECFEQLPYAG